MILQYKYATWNFLCFCWLELATYSQVGGTGTQNSQGTAMLPPISSQLPGEPVVQTPKMPDYYTLPPTYTHTVIPQTLLSGLKGCVCQPGAQVILIRQTLGWKGLNEASTQ